MAKKRKVVRKKNDPDKKAKEPKAKEKKESDNKAKEPKAKEKKEPDTGQELELPQTSKREWIALKTVQSLHIVKRFTAASVEKADYALKRLYIAFFRPAEMELDEAFALYEKKKRIKQRIKEDIERLRKEVENELEDSKESPSFRYEALSDDDLSYRNYRAGVSTREETLDEDLQFNPDKYDISEENKEVTWDNYKEYLERLDKEMSEIENSKRI